MADIVIGKQNSNVKAKDSLAVNLFRGNVSSDMKAKISQLSPAQQQTLSAFSIKFNNALNNDEFKKVVSGKSNGEGAYKVNSPFKDVNFMINNNKFNSGVTSPFSSDYAENKNHEWNV